MVSDFGCFSRFWASLVVVALVGMSEKGKMFGGGWVMFGGGWGGFGNGI